MTTRTILASSTEQTGTVRSIAAILTDLGLNLTPAGLGPTCLWFGLQNKDTAASLYNQSSASAGANDNIEVGPGVYQQFPVSAAKYDLEEEFVRVGANNQVFSITVMWG
jgi:hypothetical protein